MNCTYVRISSRYFLQGKPYRESLVLNVPEMWNTEILGNFQIKSRETTRTH